MKRILAILAIILLLFMYGATMFFALSNSVNALGWFKASVALTILVPVLIYAFMLVYKNLTGKNK